MNKQLKQFFITALVIVTVMTVGIVITTNPAVIWFIFIGSAVLLTAAFFYFEQQQQTSWSAYQKNVRQLVDQITDNDFDIEPVIDEMYFSELNRVAKYIADLNDQYSQRNSQLEAILSSLRVGLIAIDLDGKIIFSNPRFNSMYHLREDLKEQHLVANVYDKHVLNMLQEVDNVDFFEKKYVEQPTGLIYNYRAIAIIRDQQRVGKIVSVDNVTKVAKLDMMKQQFVSNVSHELKTPLTSIQGFAETLLTMNPNDPKFKEFLQIISSESDRLTNLINDILLLSEVENMKIQSPSKTVMLLPLVHEISTLLKSQQKPDVTLQIEIESKIGIRIEEFQLRQILLNLLSNAIKYTDQGSITIRAHNETKRSVLVIEDTGIGIPTEDQGRVFERFYRVDKDRSRATGGTGLGLSIVKHIVESYRGQLYLDSEVGKGTTVTVIFPVD
jgi:two-component system, OmpR family, phosphate regulon sensor histidine kinase PhoR